MSFKTTVCEVVVARRYCLYGRNTENICWEVLKQALRKELEHLHREISELLFVNSNTLMVDKEEWKDNMIL